MKKVWIALLAALLLLSGCEKKPDAQVEAECMDSQMQLQFWGKDSAAASMQVMQLLDGLEAEWYWSSETAIIGDMELYGLVFDDVQYVEDPVTGVVMEVPGTAEYEFSLRQQEVAEKALALCRRTDGAYDPQIYDAIALWGFVAGDYHVPTTDAAANAAQLSRWELDSAIKGYAGTQAVKLLETMDVDGALLNMGGVIQTYGSKGGKAWRIGVRDPQDANASVCTLEISGTMSIATAATYQRYFEQNGQLYHDILDPVSGYPVNNGIASVTVVCADGMSADCLATGLFVMGYERAVQHWQESDDFEMVIVTEDGKICATEGLKLYKSDAEIIRR